MCLAHVCCLRPVGLFCYEFVVCWFNCEPMVLRLYLMVIASLLTCIAWDICLLLMVYCLWCDLWLLVALGFGCLIISLGLDIYVGCVSWHVCFCF